MFHSLSLPLKLYGKGVAMVGEGVAYLEAVVVGDSLDNGKAEACGALTCGARIEAVKDAGTIQGRIASVSNRKAAVIERDCDGATRRAIDKGIFNKVDNGGARQSLVHPKLEALGKVHSALNRLSLVDLAAILRALPDKCHNINIFALGYLAAIDAHKLQQGAVEAHAMAQRLLYLDKLLELLLVRRGVVDNMLHAVADNG